MELLRKYAGLLAIVTVVASGCGSATGVAETSVTSENVASSTTADEPEPTTTTSSISPTEDTVASSAVVDVAGAGLLQAAGVVKIANGDGGFSADVGTDDRFGRDHDAAGDVDGDGIVDLVVGARSDDDGPQGPAGLTDAGAVYILFMNEDGTVRSHQKISSLSPDFPIVLAEGSFFGYGVAGIGDYDGDGVPDVAASAPGSRGADDSFDPSVYILHLNPDGTVKSAVAAAGIVAQGLSAIGDLDGDGRTDIVAADPERRDGGRISILFFDEFSELRADDVVTIGANEGGFAGELLAEDSFGGRESALLGDLDGDGAPELAVGGFTSDGGDGAIWILSLDNQTFEVTEQVKLTFGSQGFDEDLASSTNSNGTSGAHFGHALVAAGDLDGDGVPDLITSANQHEAGVGYVIYLNPDKTVKDFTRISASEGGFDLPLEDAERFGRSISIVDDNRAEGSIVVNFGGGAAVRQGGAIYSLEFHLS